MKKILRIRVESGSMISLGYDASENLLDIEYPSGDLSVFPCPHQRGSPLMPELGYAQTRSYTIDHHKHRFAAWAASRAASVKACRFSVEQGRRLLEGCRLAEFSDPEQLPPADLIDEQHRKWRSDVIEAGQTQGKPFTHGIAAKLINVYLKSRFVCGGYHAHEGVRNLHPPIDSGLLNTLAKLNFCGHGKAWIEHRWTTLNSEQYEQLIAFIREGLKGEPLWKIEEHWKGNQVTANR